MDSGLSLTFDSSMLTIHFPDLILGKFKKNNMTKEMMQWLIWQKLQNSRSKNTLKEKSPVLSGFFLIPAAEVDHPLLWLWMSLRKQMMIMMSKDLRLLLIRILWNRLRSLKLISQAWGSIWTQKLSSSLLHAAAAAALVPVADCLSGLL